MGFMDMIHKVINDRKKQTENGAVGYATTGKSLVDLNFAAASLRNEKEAEIVNRFMQAFYEDRVLAVKWLFFLRDVRGGLGERRSFRIILRYLATAYPDMTTALVEVMSEYGRYDDLLCLVDTPVEVAALSYIKDTLERDLVHMKAGEAVSLCAKWIPGNNASSDESRAIAKKLQRFMGLTAKQYRVMLASLRTYIGVIEQAMSANNWENIDYVAVPSKANILYRNAFIRHDKERREAFLEDVNVHKETIHAGTLMPHDIVAQYAVQDGWRLVPGKEDATLEALWSQLPNTVQDAEQILCIVDGSCSMLCPVGGTNITALHVSNALGIYFAERLGGAYRNKFITFSGRPEYVDLSNCRNLREKLALAFSHNDCSNTNIEATFDLILQTAVQNKLRQSELPKTVLIISDMEFDAATCSVDTETLFDVIERKFLDCGYKLPKLVFWNVNSRTNVVPVKQNTLGVGLVSGFSVNICNMVLTNELDPYKALCNVLSGERYQVLEKYVS